MEKIKQALQKSFERHRIVFWYDTKQELRGEFEALVLPGIDKIEIRDNEFSLKYQLLRKQPDRKFLLYREGPQPEDIENWLLDVQLGHGEFRTDQAALWLDELDLGLEFTEIVDIHGEFFANKKRRGALRELVKAADTLSIIRTKMLAICVGAEPRLDSILESLLDELSQGREEQIKLIQRCNLDSFLWQQVNRLYGYQSDLPGPRDFVLELFKSCYAISTEGQVKLSGDALVFLKRWKDSREHESAFETLSDDCCEALNIEADLQNRDYRQLTKLDYFRLIDKKIISDLVKLVTERMIPASECSPIVRQRRQSHWYKDYEHVYKAIDYAAQFFQALNEATLSMTSIEDGVRLYSESWFKIDQLYRKFIFHFRTCGLTSLLEGLNDSIENLYSNNYLLRLNNKWQEYVDRAKRWEIPGITLQKRFFQTWVQPFVLKGNKVFVIVSDALRYEAGEELVKRILNEDRYEATIEPVLSMLPSYTQLGMAALLPNHELKIGEDDSSTTYVDGQSSRGKDQRIKILQRELSQATAIHVQDLIELNRDDCRALIRDNAVVYVYQNQIDAMGHKQATEEQAFKAVEDTLDELTMIIKKLTGNNITNLIVTADHGFIYQNRIIAESDFSTAEVCGDNIFFRDRRFILGKGLVESPGLKKFNAAELGLAGDMEIQIPKSINRLRLAGSCSRFVHGGASLQEIIIPVVQIRKKKQSNVSKVEVEVLKSSSSIITSSQVGVALYQTEPVTEKLQARTLRAGIYTLSKQLISDSHELVFDAVSENAREREQQVRFVLTKAADDVDGQDVVLQLEERVPGTSHFSEYRTIRYLLRRSFTSDFDF